MKKAIIAAAWFFVFSKSVDLGVWEKAIAAAGFTVGPAGTNCIGTACTTEMVNGTPARLQAILDSYTYAVAGSTPTK